jgi:hypothetical protein
MMREKVVMPLFVTERLVHEEVRFLFAAEIKKKPDKISNEKC